MSQEDKTVKLLIGKYPTVFESQLSELNLHDIKHTKDLIKIKLEQLEPKEEYTKAVELLKKYCTTDNPKFCIHTFSNPDDKNQFFHSKCYIFATEEIKQGQYAIVGSSNFTQKGFEDNSELNYLEIQGAVINATNIANQKGHIQWFKEKWELSIDWTKDFLLTLNNSAVGKFTEKNINKEKIDDKDTDKNSDENTPYTILSAKETYYKFLIDQFGEVIDYNGKIKPVDYMPKDEKFKQLTYQIHAVNQGFSI